MINKSEALSLFFLNLPVEFKKKDIFIYPPTFLDIKDKFFPLYRSILFLQQEDILDMFNEQNLFDKVEKMPTPFEYIMATAASNEDYAQKVQKGIEFFIKEPVTLLFNANAIMVGDFNKTIISISSLDELRLINEEDFFDFQNLIRLASGAEMVEEYVADEDPRIARIKAKARYRDKIKAKSGKGISLNTVMESICCMDLGINPLNIRQIPYVAGVRLMDRKRHQEAYNLDIQSLLAGADSKKVKPKYWIENLNE